MVDLVDMIPILIQASVIFFVFKSWGGFLNNFFFSPKSYLTTIYMAIVFWFVASTMYIFCPYVCFCQLPRKGKKNLEVLYLNSHLMFKVNIALSRAAAVASKIYIFCLSVFFAFAPQGGNLERIIPGLFFEGKKPPQQV